MPVRIPTQRIWSGRLGAGTSALWLSMAFVVAACIGALPVPARAESATPGGFVESVTATQTRPRSAPALPERGKFTFPAPYGTTGVRLTNAGDCGGGNCVQYVGYSYWRNINNHVGSNTMLIFLSLSRQAGGNGPTLFSYDKTTDQVSVVGPLFDASDPLSWATGEGWYWSAGQPTKLYVNQGAKLQRYDVFAKTLETVFDASVEFGADKYIWQIHSSADDRVHSATLKTSTTYASLGCLVFNEGTREYSYIASKGDFDECQIDKSGRWLVIKENVDGQAGEDNIVIDLESGAQTVLLDQAGAAGHSDNGHGYMVAADNWHSEPGAIRLWNFGPDFPTGPGEGLLVYRSADWSADLNHVSHANARAGVPASQQYACGSGASRVERPRANEVLCFPLDGSMRVLVVAPVMTDLDAGGAGDDYSKLPKGNLDVSGRYFIWTSNAGGDRLDAFIVKVPAELLGIAPDGGSVPVPGNVPLPDSGPRASAPRLTAAVLPGSRSVTVGQTGVAFATVINQGAGVGQQCAVAPVTSIPAKFAFQATDGANQAAGPVNAPVDIQPGATRTFIIGFTAEAPLPATDVEFTFTCANGGTAASAAGLNTLMFSASSAPVPDVVALSATATGDGILDLPGQDGVGAFAVATANIGAGGSVTAAADTGDTGQPVTLLMCQTDTATGLCSSPIAPTVTTWVDPGAMPSFAVFALGHGDMPFDPVNGRIIVRFRDKTGEIRGMTSVAVRTQ